VFGKLLTIFIVLPAVELMLLLQVHSLIDTTMTFLLILCTGVVGAWLAKRQGRRALRMIREQLDKGELPGDAVLDGVIVFVAGALLVTPGVLTDVTGLSLLVPVVRKPIRKYAYRRIQAYLNRDRGPMMGGPGMGYFHASPWASGQDDVIDVTAESPYTPAPHEVVSAAPALHGEHDGDGSQSVN